MDSVFHDSTTVIFGIITIVLTTTIFVILGAAIVSGYAKNKNEYEERMSNRERNKKN